MNYSKKKKLPVVLEREEAIRLIKIPNKRYLTPIFTARIIVIKNIIGA